MQASLSLSVKIPETAKIKNSNINNVKLWFL